MKPCTMLGGVLVVATVVGCASTDTTGGLQGQAGPLTWEVSQVRQARQADQITWWYTLVLRNSSTSVIDLQRVTTGTIAPGDSWGGQSSQPYVRRIAAGDEVRLDNQQFTFSCPNCDSSKAETVFRGGIVLVFQFEGVDDQGKSIRAPVRIRLDSSKGTVLK
jgi:hypothetical protein